MIIGITGTNGSGKDTVAGFLAEKLGWPHFSLSDELREICKEKDIEPNRDNLIDLGNKLRETYGADYLSNRILDKVQTNFIVTSIRNPAEIEPFKLKDRFILLAIDALIKVRYQRIVDADKRMGKKVGEGNISLDQFKSQESREMKGSHFSQQLEKLIVMADAKIENDGTIEELKNNIDKLLGEIIK